MQCRAKESKVAIAMIAASLWGQGEGFIRPGNYLCCETHTDSFLCSAGREQALKTWNSISCRDCPIT
jgi:hypothetical protein